MTSPAFAATTEGLIIS